ncbi:MAG TPA: tetratricopeptide repeat protein [Steroidobacteraceae bacterium]|nr:tetratricopeptide repeat protein [Steroidobacteraceae bacterium]
MFSFSNFIRASLGLGALALSACAGSGLKAEPRAPQSFYTVTGEIALARGEPRVAALQYAMAAAHETDPAILQRATEVAAETLQPSLMADVAARWLFVNPRSLDAQRAAARAALALYRVDEAAAHYRIVLLNSPEGVEAEFAGLETDLDSDENVFGAHQLADRLAAYFPTSSSALKLQGLAALRADDPAAAVHSLTNALEIEMRNAVEAQLPARKELAQTLLRARIMAGDVEEPLNAAQAQLKAEDSPTNRFNYVALLMTAQRLPEATEQLEILARNADSTAVALRLLGLLEFQQGHFDAASARFKQLLRSGKFTDDAFYYLALIEDRNGDAEGALRLYAQVRSGENVLPALLRAATLLHTHGAAGAADELFDRLIEDEPQRAPEILTARARMYSQSSELPKAFAVLEKGALEYPDSVELRYAAASVYEEQGQVSAALRELSSVLKARPNDPAAMNALGFTLADHDKELSRARRLIERAHAAAPKNAAILDSLGWVLFRQGHATEALPYLNAAYGDEHDGDIAAHLGEVLWQLGRQDEAQRIWSEAGALDADNHLLKSTRHRLTSTN